MPAKKAAPEGELVPKNAEIDAFVSIVKNDAELSLAYIQAIEITKPADREFASNALAEVAKTLDTIDAKRKSWVDPIKAVAADIDATFRPVTKTLQGAVELLKAKIGAYDLHIAQERERLLREATAAVQAGDAPAAIATIERAEDFVTADSGASSKFVWTGEVADAALIPREYLTPDLAKLEAITKATGADPKIPGWRAYQKALVRTSRKGVAK